MTVHSDSELDSQSLTGECSIIDTRATSPMDLVEERPKPSARQNKNSVAQLIDEATRYDMKSDYYLPKSFLRDRSKIKKGSSSNNDFSDNSIKNNTKQKVRKSSKTDKINKTGNDKVKDSAENVISEDSNAALSKGKGKVMRKKGNKINEQKIRDNRSPSETKLIDADCVQGSQNYFLKNPEVLTSIHPSFFTFDPAFIYNTLKDPIIHSTVLSGKPNGPNIHVIKLYSLIYKDFYEEFLIDFVSKLGRYNPMLEIGQTVEANVRIYFPTSFKTEGMLLVKNLNHAYEKCDGNRFKNLIDEYNILVGKIPSSLIFQHLKGVKSIPASFLYNFLTTCYTRAIYPNAKQLKKYASFSNFVYGELMPEFLTKAYKQCGLKPGDVFLDLGSGVGNCVLQSALEFGCKLSFGCEIMDSASKLTEIHLKELQSRCKMWSINLNIIEFSLRKSFVDNERVQELIGQCDVILINNFIFDPPLNKKVEKIVQGLKPGAKIISLKSIRPPGYTINYDDVENIFNKLKVETFPLPENSVSWTHRSVGNYFISTVEEDIDESIFHAPIFGKIRRRKPVRYTR